MKKYLLFPLVLIFFVSIKVCAQSFSLTENEPVFVYSLPKTELCIEVDIEKITQVPGEFYQYSERYLATKDVITENKTIYRLKKINVITNAVPDPARTYSLLLNKNFPFGNIVVNEKGILCGINTKCCTKKPIDTSEKKQEVKENINNLLPLTEEYMMASSTSKMAEGAAKTIYRIRENRINLLSGDVDHLPADGDSFTTMLNGMNQLERQLTELFTGRMNTEVQTHNIFITPDKQMNDEVLFRISTSKGLVPAQDLSGSPYYIKVLPEKANLVANPRKSTKAELYTILPAKTQVSIGDGKNTFFSELYFIPQFGAEIPVPSELLQKKEAQIIVDPETGRLLNIK